MNGSQYPATTTAVVAAIRAVYRQQIPKHDPALLTNLPFDFPYRLFKVFGENLPKFYNTMNEIASTYVCYARV